MVVRKRKWAWIVISIITVFTLLVLSWFIYVIRSDPFSPYSPNYYYRDRTEYPLEMVNAGDNSEYMLVKWRHSPETYEVITDTQMIKENVSEFSIDNRGEIYGVTADGCIWLFKDSELIDTVIFDDTYTEKIEYGTLQFQEISLSQYELLRGENDR